MWSAVFPAAAHKFTPQPPLDKKVAYLKAIWQTDCCTMQLLNARLTLTISYDNISVGLLDINIVSKIMAH